MKVKSLWKQTDLSPPPHALAVSLCPHSEGESHFTAAVSMKIKLDNKRTAPGIDSLAVFQGRPSSGRGLLSEGGTGRSRNSGSALGRCHPKKALGHRLYSVGGTDLPKADLVEGRIHPCLPHCLCLILCSLPVCTDGMFVLLAVLMVSWN